MKHVLMIIIPFILAAGAVYGVSLGGEYIVMPAEKRITSLPSSADSALKKREQALALISSIPTVKRDGFTMRPIDDSGLIAQFDNSAVYERLAELENSQGGSVSLKEDTDSPPQYKINSILKGEDRTFAVINGKIYHRGDKISEDEKIARIETRRILLKGKWGERWIAVNF